jgi:hypothetical protein
MMRYGYAILAALVALPAALRLPIDAASEGS